MRPLRQLLCWLTAGLFLFAGYYHFRNPAMYLGMMPGWVPQPVTVNLLVGAAECLGALGLVFAATRRLAGWALIALMVAVFPANVHAALQGQIPGFYFSPLALVLRLPLQGVFIFWVWWTAVRRTREENREEQGRRTRWS